MVDIIPAALPPELALPVTVAQQIAAIETIVKQLPQQLIKLERQLLLGGTLTTNLEAGQAQIRTPQGDVQLVLPRTLFEQIKSQQLQQLLSVLQADKSNAYIQLQPGNPPAKATLLVDYVNQPVQTRSQAAATNSAASSAIKPGQNLTAFVLPQDASKLFQQFAPAAQQTIQQQPLQTATSGLLQQIRNFTQQSVSYLQNTTGSILHPAAQSEVAARAPTSLPQGQQNAAGTLNATAGTAITFKPGQNINFHLNAVAAGAQAKLTATGDKILATVIANTPGGQVVVNAGENTLFVRQAANWPVGTQLLLSTIATARPDTALPTLAEGAEWPALKQVLDALGSIDPGLRQQIVQNRIPQPGQQMSSAMLFLFSALNQGDVRGLLGQRASEALDKIGKHALLKLLSDELRGGVRTATDPVVGEWRHYHLPFLDQFGMSALNLYVHRDRHKAGQETAEDKKEAQQTRFLIDVTFTRLGAMQLDGFVQPKKLDLIIRSDRDLGRGLERDLQGAFSDALVLINYAGNINFQHGRGNWIGFLNAPHEAVSLA
ncbi:MAG: hypothetical protein GC131_04275 [Alphaproteobacteria bacterium]|nr:hypothetical protein [Alphaproteobacteria bacterium]